jgi:hypothetical protein
VARKAWDDLSPAYRARLERKGVTEDSHRAGASLSKARGHKSSAEENERRRTLRQIRKYVKTFSEEYNLTAKGEQVLTEHLRAHTSKEAQEHMWIQESAYELFMSGMIQQAGAVWSLRENDAPEWMFWYHGPFRH